MKAIHLIATTFITCPSSSLRYTFSNNYRIIWSRESAKYTQIPFFSTLQMSTGAGEEKYVGDLYKFAAHTSHEYHDFTASEAAEIRSALLKWYRANRRRLPWRGDPGPFNGSTAGTASSTAKKKNAKKIGGQKNIDSFFTKKEKGSKTRKHDKKEFNSGEGNSIESDTIISADAAVIPVTGYSVWVSEIMLQQTRVEAVIKYYLKWMESFPTVYDLANATEEEVNAHWAGLGFYRRARLLHQGAKFVVDDLDGVVPDNVDELLKISGVGRYTASAIASIAYGKCVPVVDGNVCRVLSRLKGIANNIKAPIFKDKLGWRLAEQIVTAGDGKHAGEVNQALMELGATYCAPSGSGIDEADCLKDFYLSTKIGRDAYEVLNEDNFEMSDFVYKTSRLRGKSSCSLCENEGISNVLFQLADDILSAQDEPGFSIDSASTIGHANFPTAPPKKAKREEILSVAVMSHTLDASGHERWLMTKRPSDGLLAGQWEFPASCAWSSGKESKGAQTKGKKTGDIPSLSKSALQSSMSSMLRNCSVSHGEGQISLEDIWDENVMERVVVSDSPIVHIFSHVRWIMYCEYSDVSSSTFSSTFERFYENEAKDIRWMSEDDMKHIGISSSVKKILAAVKSCKAKRSCKKRKLK